MVLIIREPFRTILVHGVNLMVGDSGFLSFELGNNGLERVQWDAKRGNTRHVGICFRKVPYRHHRPVALSVRGLEKKIELTLQCS